MNNRKLTPEETLTTLRAIEYPKDTITWKVIRHDTLFDEVSAQLQTNNFDIKSYDINVDKNYNVMLAKFNITHKELPEDGVLGRTLVIQNSINKTKSVKEWTGAVVLKCLNGMIGEDVYTIGKHKHTGNNLWYNIDDITMRAINDLKTDRTFGVLKQVKDKLSNKLITRDEQNYCLGSLADGILPIEIISNMYKYRDSETNLFPLQEDNTCTEWDMFNWGTEFIKKSHVGVQMKLYRELFKYFYNN